MTMRCERLTNFLAVVHAVAGEDKAKDVGTHFGGANFHIGHRHAKVTEKNCLRSILTDEEIFEVRRRFLDLEGKLKFGCITIPKTYTPGVFKQPMKRDLILGMYKNGLCTDNEIMREVGCSLQYFQTVVQDRRLYQEGKIMDKNIISKLDKWLKDTYDLPLDIRREKIRNVLYVLNTIKSLKGIFNVHLDENGTETIIQLCDFIFDDAKEAGFITPQESKYPELIKDNDELNEEEDVSNE